MSKVSITISQDVLNSLSPQKGMLNAKSGDLLDQTFNLHSIVIPTGKKAKDLDKYDADSTMLIKARYINASNKKSFLIPVRGLLNLDIAQVDSKNAKYDPLTTATVKVHEHLLEVGTSGKSSELPPSFKVVAVTNRLQEGTGHIMYPPYCYKDFSDAVNDLRKVDENADLSSIYTNYEFMNGLYAEDRMERFSAVEATKVIVISI